MQLFNKLQAEFAANVFTPHVYDGRKLEEKDRVFRPAVYDGCKNMFTMYQLLLGNNNSGQVFIFVLYLNKDYLHYFSSLRSPRNMKHLLQKMLALQRFTQLS